MTPEEIIGSRLSGLRSSRPMVHHITNNVVTNFTANVTLCLGASPVMAPCIEESPEMVRFAGALLLNIGTPYPTQVESMLAAGRAANEAGIPIVLDPVGAGATAFRNETAARLVEELDVAVIRGNAGEILSLAGIGGKTRGVDSMESSGDKAELFASIAGERKWTVAVTGAVDVVTDGKRTAVIGNGHPLMSMVTGTGCAATTAVACFAAACDDPFEAALSGISVTGLAGERAARLAGGPGTFVPYFLDALAAMNQDSLPGELKVSVNA